MAELISKEKVLWCLKASSEEIDWGQSEDGDAFKHYIGAVYRTIAIIKTEQPDQKHGHWIVSGEPPIMVKTCSECNIRIFHHSGCELEKFCAWCGAKMDKGVKPGD